MTSTMDVLIGLLVAIDNTLDTLDESLWKTWLVIDVCFDLLFIEQPLLRSLAGHQFRLGQHECPTTDSKGVMNTVLLTSPTDIMVGILVAIDIAIGYFGWVTFFVHVSNAYLSILPFSSNPLQMCNSRCKHYLLNIAFVAHCIVR